MQPGHAVPDDHIAGRRIMFAGEIAAKHGDLQQVSGERGPLEARSRSGRVDPVERSDLGEVLAIAERSRSAGPSGKGSD